MLTIVIVSQRQEEERDLEISLLSFMKECFLLCCVTDIRETARHLRTNDGRRRTFLERLVDCVWAEDKCVSVCVMEVNVWAERR